MTWFTSLVTSNVTPDWFSISASSSPRGSARSDTIDIFLMFSLKRTDIRRNEFTARILPGVPRMPRWIRSRLGTIPFNLGFHRSEEHTSELQSRENLVCRLLLEKKKKI